MDKYTRTKKPETTRRQSFYKTCMPQYLPCTLMILLLLFSGCAASEPARFFILGPVAEPMTHGSQAISENQAPIIVIGPIEMPEYLNRPHIVTRISNSEIHFSEFNRWAQSLENSFSSVLAENISKIMSIDSVFTYPWISSGEIDYRTEANIVQFDCTPGKNITLKVNWSLLGKDGKTPLLVKKSSFIEPVEGQGCEKMVTAMNLALARFSREIAEAIMDAGKNMKEIK